MTTHKAHHTRCFAETRGAYNGPVESSQIVGNLRQQDDGRWYIEDCYGSRMPLGKILETYKGKLICLNLHNLEYNYQSHGAPPKRELHHEGP